MVAGTSPLTGGTERSIQTNQLDRLELADALREFHTETGRSLLDLVDESPVLLVFLRHFACAFCAQTLDRVSQVREQIAARGTRPVFVHLGSPERAKPYFDYYHLSDVERISNPDASLYQHPAFALSHTPNSPCRILHRIL